jgi:hypothetical protein
MKKDKKPLSSLLIECDGKGITYDNVGDTVLLLNSILECMRHDGEFAQIVIQAAALYKLEDVIKRDQDKIKQLEQDLRVEVKKSLNRDNIN